MAGILSEASEYEMLSWFYFGVGLASFALIFVIASALSKSLFARHKFDLHTQWEYIMRWNSSAHSLLAAAFSVWWLYSIVANFDPQNQMLRGVMPFAGVLSSISIAYFIWDTLAFLVMDYKVEQHWHSLSAKQREGKTKPPKYGDVLIVIHHIVAAAGQLTSVPYLKMPFTYSALLGTEVTTPMLNLLWMMEKTNLNKSLAYKAIGGVFLLCWVVFRLFSCGYCAYHMACNFWDILAELPTSTMLVCCVIVPFLLVLNWYWFILIIKTVFFDAPKPDAADKKKSDGDDAADAGGAANSKHKKNAHAHELQQLDQREGHIE